MSMSYSQLVHNKRCLAKARLSLAQFRPRLFLHFLQPEVVLICELVFNFLVILLFDAGLISQTLYINLFMWANWFCLQSFSPVNISFDLVKYILTWWYIFWYGDITFEIVIYVLIWRSLYLLICWSNFGSVDLLISLSTCWFLEGGFQQQQKNMTNSGFRGQC